ncbi:hypothetical protein LPJ63_004581 [Coemansia sp. RSA 2711]|nr:hypothetical protein LPJ63_004581 [Coemansia sp. RSA 2711]
MGSLSAQIAHVQFLGLQSLTDAAGSWAPEHLASTLLWAQHRGQYALLLEQTLASPHALLCDAALFACIRQPALLLPEAERVLSALPPASYLQLSAHVLAQLSQISGPIRAAYASGLCALTLQCQQSMLCGEDDSLADQLLERWELIKVV